MSSLKERIELLDKLHSYMMSDDEQWQTVKELATSRNSWFTPESIDIAINNITEQYLDKKLLEKWAGSYPVAKAPKKIGIVTAGNIPLVGFHDFLCSFISGHISQIKLSSKDDILLKHLVEKLIEWEPGIASFIIFADNLKNCDAYIATGSNNTSRYFEQYFSKYPNIIRKNRTSVAILTGDETTEELQALGRDIFTYFGLGCRNVTKVYLPEGYDIQQLMDGLSSYSDIIHHHKYKNNYDYYLSIYLLNKIPYITNDFLLMVENSEPFSPISTLHYEYYTDYTTLLKNLSTNDMVQAIVDNKTISFGDSQSPDLTDYADGVDTMMFLSTL